MAERWQPDRIRGVFETLLVVDGEPIELHAHLARLAHSLESVYSLALPPQAEKQLRRAATDLHLARLRLTAAPGEDGPQLHLLAGGVELGAVFPVGGVKLRSFSVTGGLGEHKWAHRPGINRPTPGEAGALIVDEGEVLEAGKEFGIIPCGLGARNTLRLESAMALYGHEISETINVFEAGLGRYAKLEKGSDFVGREALVEVEAAAQPEPNGNAVAKS